ncbi:MULTISPECIES: phage portal protein [Vibrio harveyi group]|uniref:phage portal protein n=1 Tax=Vibrio harveyi group TaxID=717610 RepID=UPI00111FC133|nr:MULTISPECIES: phage portal protein [Vibrio harveyi group]MBE5145598.1 phage portal protein [Vibrio parahaemolyticus]MBT0052663.1 phage portal protein [Vibrio alginolyticus]MCR9374496.1 phage portal protein [Vibrio alginolyticus]MCR9408469.1 phage portal protein [Vibrio alginolyticus]TNZ12524.1 phage portal protein [Vibrio parahaemolyticus]
MTEQLVQAEHNDNKSVYSFDPNPEPVDTTSWMTRYCELVYNDTDDFWEPPISLKGLADIANANGYHGSLLKARANYVAGRFTNGGSLPMFQMNNACWDYFGLGMAAFVKIRNYLKQVIALAPLPMVHMRKRKNGDFVQLLPDYKQKNFKAKDVIFIPQYDPQQQVYGLPDYLGSIQSSLLNRDATLFRRRYYLNGAHMGFIFYATDPNLSEEDEEALKTKIASSKGIGNFRSMFVNIPNGKEKGIQLIPVGDIATKDEFERIKNITAQDIFVGHRFPAGMGGMIPQTGSTIPDPIKVSQVYDRYEVIPVCKRFADAVNSDPEIPKSLHMQFDLKI